MPGFVMLHSGANAGKLMQHEALLELFALPPMHRALSVVVFVISPVLPSTYRLCFGSKQLQYHHQTHAVLSLNDCPGTLLASPAICGSADVFATSDVSAGMGS